MQLRSVYKSYRQGRQSSVSYCTFQVSNESSEFQLSAAESLTFATMSSTANALHCCFSSGVKLLPDQMATVHIVRHHTEQSGRYLCLGCIKWKVTEARSLDFISICTGVFKGSFLDFPSEVICHREECKRKARF